MADWYSVAWPLLRQLNPESAHGMALRALRRGMTPRPAAVVAENLQRTLWGLDFPNPVGLAAGFDKDGEVPDQVLDLGFGFTEVGSITPEPQPGNPQPRLFRLIEDRGVINRMGFNSKGLEIARQNLSARPRRGIVGVNLGKNKTSPDAAADYIRGVEILGPLADYLVVNVSSPNTPGLRALQGREELSHLLSAVKAARDGLQTQPPLLLKIAPDLTDEDKADTAAVVLDLAIDGLIATNTTITRPDSLSAASRTEIGGLSGQPLTDLATRVLSDMYKLTEGKLPLIGVGGIANGRQAYARIRAGASLIQIYSAMIYEGPGLAARINRELSDLLTADGFTKLSDAVGVDCR
ncbi:quinone-dependent dihydroorotate dehydrogenase [Magnetospira sp. QH-2]|uniref:quinone-dependent dihydroorotate dehydrogenase n=1 Tax=Magnetospira sp. (strain QH-2) TaxID=1288970 RepID=UPI0003E81B78|nr:quinone-dependent dihydroorotate dehydrogenase [Magnetospira sp. QH-2]CCQ74089.1 Dihydro-orotate oxidase, FMN-linked (UMP biosynthesis) [Magnetospira sp. QH-2]